MRLSTEPWRQCAKSLTLEHGMLAISGSRVVRFRRCQMEKFVCDMEQYKHELEQIDVSKADKTNLERVLKHTQFRGGVGSLGWFVDHCCPQLSFQLAELRRKPGVTDSSRCAETQQSDPHSEGD